MQSLYPLIPFAVVALGLIVAVLMFRKKVGAGGRPNAPAARAVAPAPTSTRGRA